MLQLMCNPQSAKFHNWPTFQRSTDIQTDYAHPTKQIRFTQKMLDAIVNFTKQFNCFSNKQKEIIKPKRS